VTAGDPIAVIGAGAAGLMAAIHAAGSGRPVLILERTADGGRKILISGGGRCNVLPSTLDPSRFVTASSPHSLRKLLRSWPLDAQRSFFEQDLNLPLRLEPETGKLFPVSNRARDIRDRLVARARALGVEFRFRASVQDLRPAEEPGQWRVQCEGGASVTASAVILATGGSSVPTTGSDGTGLAIAEHLGHTIHETYPALTPLTASPAVHADLAGVSLAATVRGEDHGRPVSSTGGFLFTHRGYSGPAVLDLSHLAVRSRSSGGSRAELRVAWKGLGPEEWEQRLTPVSAEGVATALRRELPARLAEMLLREADVPADRPLAQLRREERLRLIARLTGYPLPWTGDEGYRKAEVTGGGVALGEVHLGTLESRVVPGLFLAGEMLDAFGPIGGYNFAWAWATGRLAGLGAASRPEPR
jgi:predicted Rossmann fold flavoprotein